MSLIVARSMRDRVSQGFTGSPDNRRGSNPRLAEGPPEWQTMGTNKTGQARGPGLFHP